MGFGCSAGLSLTGLACGPLRFPNRTDETKALARQRLDQALFLTGIADCSPGGIQARCQRRVGYAAPIPNGFDEVVLADNSLPVADQVIDQVKYLWRDGDDVCPAMQLAPVGVECVTPRRDSARRYFPKLLPTVSIAGCRRKNKPSVRKK